MLHLKIGKVDGTEKLQDSSAKVAGNATAIKDFKMGKKNYAPIASAIAETRVVAEGSMAALPESRVLIWTGTN